MASFDGFHLYSLFLHHHRSLHSLISTVSFDNYFNQSVYLSLRVLVSILNSNFYIYIHLPSKSISNDEYVFVLGELRDIKLRFNKIVEENKETMNLSSVYLPNDDKESTVKEE